MIDFLNEIFTAVAKALREAHPGITVTGEYTRQPSKFPTATLDEIENVMVDELEDSSAAETFSGLTYRLQVSPTDCRSFPTSKAARKPRHGLCSLRQIM